MEDISILIVDDSAEKLHQLQGILSAAGYQVQMATDGRRALNAAQSAPPDLILLDIVMPEMDGYELCRRLKAKPKTGFSLNSPGWMRFGQMDMAWVYQSCAELWIN